MVGWLSRRMVGLPIQPKGREAARQFDCCQFTWLNTTAQDMTHVRARQLTGSGIRGVTDLLLSEQSTQLPWVYRGDHNIHKSTRFPCAFPHLAHRLRQLGGTGGSVG
jgi:hypothetical protein